MYIHSDSLA